MSLAERPPYALIAERLRTGNVILFLGAGFNHSARPHQATWSQGSQFTPSTSELADLLARRARLTPGDEPGRADLTTPLWPGRSEPPSPHGPPDVNDLATVASYYAEEMGRTSLEQLLRDIYNVNYPITPSHQHLARVPAPLLIVDVNYDDLLERAFAAAGRPYDLVSTVAGNDGAAAASVSWLNQHTGESLIVPSDQLFIDLEQTTVIYKVLGTINRPSRCVITEEDYLDLFSQMWNGEAIPAVFSRHFRNRSFLFLGYSLRDWFTRALLWYLTTRTPRWGLPSWSVHLSLSQLEVRLLGAMGLRVYTGMIPELFDRLAEHGA